MQSALAQGSAHTAAVTHGIRPAAELVVIRAEPAIWSVLAGAVKATVLQAGRESE